MLETYFVNKHETRMREKLKNLDPVLVTGILISIFSALILVLLGKDEVSIFNRWSLITSITLGVDVIGRVKESKSNLLQAIKLGTTLDANPELHTTVSEIVDLYLSSLETNFDLLKHEAKMLSWNARIY